jgi:hypothetical protein
MNVSIESYNEPSPQANAMYVEINDLELWFSYKTVIAFRSDSHPLTVCENVWSTTTGKHLNLISRDKKSRLPYDQFMAALEEATK